MLKICASNRSDDPALGGSLVNQTRTYLPLARLCVVKVCVPPTPVALATGVKLDRAEAVSYTHLTLPTIYSV